MVSFVKTIVVSILFMQGVYGSEAASSMQLASGVFIQYGSSAVFTQLQTFRERRTPQLFATKATTPTISKVAHSMKGAGQALQQLVQNAQGTSSDFMAGTKNESKEAENNTILAEWYKKLSPDQKRCVDTWRGQGYTPGACFRLFRSQYEHRA